jgi:putative transposase
VTVAVKTLRVKVRPDAWGWLNEAAREVNMAWNHVNALCAKAARPYYGAGKRLTGYDVGKLLAGTAAHLTYLNAHTVTRIAMEHAAKRQQTRRTRLSWRKSGGSRRSLGWVPFRNENLRWRDGAIVFAGRRVRVFDSYGLGDHELRAGCFAQNALGEWFLNVTVRASAPTNELPARAVGIDLGLKAVATTSDGTELPAARFFRDAEPKIAQAQRRGHKRQAKRIHQDAANRRKDALHKFSSAMVREYGAIYIGDVSVAFAKSRAPKATLDSGWGMLKTMLQSKGHQAGRIVEVVDEKYTTQACADCGSLTGPKGRTGLVVRGWACVACGSTHSRDVNAARNIRARGLSGPSAGTTARAQQ